MIENWKKFTVSGGFELSFSPPLFFLYSFFYSYFLFVLREWATRPINNLQKKSIYPLILIFETMYITLLNIFFESFWYQIHMVRSQANLCFYEKKDNQLRPFDQPSEQYNHIKDFVKLKIVSVLSHLLDCNL